ncbi:hypothetical protein [Streptomyces sp. NPDC004230]
MVTGIDDHSRFVVIAVGIQHPLAGPVVRRVAFPADLGCSLAAVSPQEQEADHVDLNPRIVPQVLTVLGRPCS